MMERRKRAFEEAALQRQGKSQSSDKPIISQLTEKIEYTNTRVIHPNHQVLTNNRIVVDSQQGFYADIYRMLRTKVLQSMRQNGWNTLGVTSPNPGEGKTVTTINLAISLAKELNQTILLVDFDLRRPSVHRYFGLNDSPGISDYIVGSVEIEQTFVNPGVERLVLLPGHDPIQNSSETLSSPQFAELINDIKTRYADRIVLFDLPPLLVIDDALTMAPHIDAYLLVVEDGMTDEEDLRSANKMLSGLNVLGSVLNKSDVMPKSYYDYYV